MLDTILIFRFILKGKSKMKTSGERNKSNNSDMTFEEKISQMVYAENNIHV